MSNESTNLITEIRNVSNSQKNIAQNIYRLPLNSRIVLINGGLGNQLCQYFFYHWLRCQLKAPIIADTTEFLVAKEHNGFELKKIFGFNVIELSDIIPSDIFNDMINRMREGERVPEQLYQAGYPITLLAEVDAPKFSGTLCFLPSYYPAHVKNTGMIYYHAYHIIGHYYNDLRQNNAFPEDPFPPIIGKGEKNEQYARDIISTESVALHIRRGDFVEFGWAFPLELYAKAIRAMNEKLSNPTYFIFSDDLNFCSENLSVLGLQSNEVVFVEGNVKPNNYIDMQLMSMCKHRIVNNSSFCFCAALFRQDRDGIVINLLPQRQVF